MTLSGRLQFVAGVLVIDRNRRTSIPAGGVPWNRTRGPTTSLCSRSRRWRRGTGRPCGGTWRRVRRRDVGVRPDGTGTSVDSNEYRLLLGAEVPRADRWAITAGPVFGRSLEFDDGTQYPPRAALWWPTPGCPSDGPAGYGSKGSPPREVHPSRDPAHNERRPERRVARPLHPRGVDDLLRSPAMTPRVADSIPWVRTRAGLW